MLDLPGLYCLATEHTGTIWEDIKGWLFGIYVCISLLLLVLFVIPPVWICAKVVGVFFGDRQEDRRQEPRAGEMPVVRP
jgi:hypothetical protein